MKQFLLKHGRILKPVPIIDFTILFFISSIILHGIFK